MNRSIALIMLLIAMLVAVGCRRTDQESIVGTWTAKSEDGKKDLVLRFSADGRIDLDVDGDVGNGTYQVDLSKVPAHLDIDWGSRGKVKSIFQLLDETRLRVENIEPGDPRPETFTETAMVLTRKQ